MRKSATTFHAPWCHQETHPAPESTGDPCTSRYVEINPVTFAVIVNRASGPAVLVHADAEYTPAQFEQFCTDGLKMLGTLDR